MILLTMTTVASLQTVGVVLVVAMLITTASTAYLLTNRLWVMILLSAFFGALSAVICLYYCFIYILFCVAVIVFVSSSYFFFVFIFLFIPCFLCLYFLCYQF